MPTTSNPKFLLTTDAGQKAFSALEKNFSANDDLKLFAKAIQFDLNNKLSAVKSDSIVETIKQVKELAVKDLNKIQAQNSLQQTSLEDYFKKMEEQAKLYLSELGQKENFGPTDAHNTSNKSATIKGMPNKPNDKKKPLYDEEELKELKKKVESKHKFDPKTNAFVFEDASTVTKEEGKEIVDSLDKKGFKTLVIEGPFQEKTLRAMWLQASLKGMEVEGYKPDKKDKEALAESKAEQAKAPAADGQTTPVAANSTAGAEIKKIHEKDKAEEKTEEKAKEEEAAAANSEASSGTKTQQSGVKVIPALSNENDASSRPKPTPEAMSDSKNETPDTGAGASSGLHH